MKYYKFQIGDKVMSSGSKGTLIVGIIIAVSNHSTAVSIEQANGRAYWWYEEDLSLIPTAIDKLNEIL